MLVAETETAHGRPILITQHDIRELQLAKGAIAAGIQVLMEQLGIGFEDIGEVLLAGAFGNYIDPHSATAVGLLPPLLEAKVRPIGNVAGAGAKAALLSRREYRRAAQIADFVEYIELSAYQNSGVDKGDSGIMLDHFSCNPLGSLGNHAVPFRSHELRRPEVFSRLFRRPKPRRRPAPCLYLTCLAHPVPSICYPGRVV